MGNLGSRWSVPTDSAFYALLPPDAFDTEHYVYAECQRINLAWHVRPILSGRTIASLQVQPDHVFARTLDRSVAIGIRERIVSKAEALSGLDTYRFSYVCFALAGTWTYGIVTQCISSDGVGDQLVVTTKMGVAYVALNDPTLLVVTLAGYALRPFDGLPLALHTVTTVETATAAIVGHFLASDRHAALDYAALGLSHLPRLPPPNNMLLPCAFDNITQCELSVGHILDVVYTAYRHLRREDTRALRGCVAVTRPREPDDATEQDRPSKRQKRQEVTRWIRSKDGGTLTTTDVPDLKTVAVGARLLTTTLRKLFANYGGFPPSVYVRKEMKMVWDLLRVNFTLPDADDSTAVAALEAKHRPDTFLGGGEGSAPRDTTDALWLPLLLTGSPGIGKSALLALFCAYLGVYHDVNVLLTRRVKYVNSNVSDGATLGDAVFLFRGGHVTKYPGFNRKDYWNLLEEFKAETRAQGKTLLVVGDGYLELNFQSQDDFTSAVASSNILSTSAQYRIKDDDNRVPLVLPAWSKDALCDACAISEEVMSTFEERYVLAGGCLRSFLVSPRSQWLSRCPSALTDEDEIRRTYIQDIGQYGCYLRRGQRVLDAGVVQRHWVAMERIAAVADALRWVETTTYTALHRSLYEAMIHKLAFDGILQLVLMGEATPLVVTARFDAALDNASKVDYISYFKTRWIDKTYWAPNYYVLLPGIDAICVQDKCVYYLQMSVTPVRQLPWDAIQEVHDVISSNPHLAGFDYIYVIVIPPATVVAHQIPSEIEGLRVCFTSAREAAGARNLASLL